MLSVVVKFGGHVTSPKHDNSVVHYGIKLLNGSPQLSVRVIMFPLTLIVPSSTVIPGTIAGTPTYT